MSLNIRGTVICFTQIFMVSKAYISFTNKSVTIKKTSEKINKKNNTQRENGVYFLYSAAEAKLSLGYTEPTELN